jgi:2-dehydro-3-deoxy-D-gluconate 5-dehydrogenase
MHKSMMDMYDLTGKTAVVTGGSQGLGESFARGLAKAGCNLVLTARTFSKLEKVAGEMNQYGIEALPVAMDVNKREDIEAMVKKATDKFGKIDILVNNAGISAVSEAEDMTDEQFQSVIQTNIGGVFLCSQIVGREMLKQGHGKIINIASMYSFVGASYVPQVSYTTSKAGVLGMTREMAVEWAPKGVQVMALAPGFFRSDQTIWAFEQNKELGEKLLARVPMGRMGRLEELEGTIVFLASAASGYMAGQTLTLDGGFLSW